jgi:hypothetical protein
METWRYVVGIVEQVLEPLGFMSYPFGVAKRMIFGGLVGLALISLLKPSFMFKPDGTTRSFTYLASAEDRESGATTLFPWFLAPILGAFFLGVLV